MKKHNFSAGPAILPEIVFAEAAEAVKEFNGNGLSLLEMSHRSPALTEVLNEAHQLPKDLLGLSDDYEVLYLTGGASTQFFMTAMNFLGQEETAAYVDTGSWSTKAIKEAKAFGNVDVVATSKDKNFSYIPKGYHIPENAAYLHLTSNNTIFGTQHQSFPDIKAPIICDMSSDIFSRPLDVEKFGVIYAGAQKNLGPAGTTLVIIRKDMLNRIERSIPTMLDYNTHIAKASAFNTPPCFPIYVCMLTMRWIKKQGGLSQIAANNEEKAAILYNEIDSNPLFLGTTAKEDRSLMNVTFVMEDKSLEESFLKTCIETGISGIKGHRSVGGFRASIYNAMPKTSIQVLVDVMSDFAQRNG